MFGTSDPFGNFQLLFGAANLSLKIMEMPGRYYERAYGQTKIQRWYHGWLLHKIFLIAFRRLQFR